jgi:hypothetical protein
MKSRSEDRAAFLLLLAEVFVYACAGAWLIEALR